MSAIESRRLWELVRCSGAGCTHEHVRPRAGRLMLPCGVCGSAMVCIPLTLRVDDAVVVGGRFCLAEMRSTLEYVAERERELADDEVETAVSRAVHAGRAEAFSEALEMIGVILADVDRVNRKPDDGPGADELVGVSAGRQLRTPSEASA